MYVEYMVEIDKRT